MLLGTCWLGWDHIRQQEQRAVRPWSNRKRKRITYFLEASACLLASPLPTVSSSRTKGEHETYSLTSRCSRCQCAHCVVRAGLHGVLQPRARHPVRKLQTEHAAPARHTRLVQQHMPAAHQPVAPPPVRHPLLRGGGYQRHEARCGISTEVACLHQAARQHAAWRRRNRRHILAATMAPTSQSQIRDCTATRAE